MAGVGKLATPNRRRRRRSRRRPSPDQGNRPIPLQKRAADQFNRANRQRGTVYFRDDRVDMSVEGERATAVVKGKKMQPFGVGLDWSQMEDRGFLHVYCQCRRFSDGTPCEHIWAGLLALNQTGAEGLNGSDAPIKLRRDRANAWKGLRAQVAESRRNSGRNAPQRNTARTPAKAKAVSVRPRRVDLSGWRGRLDSLRGEIEQAAQEATLTGQKAVTLDVRLLLNSEATPNSGGLVLDVFLAEEGKRGRPDKLKPGRAPNPVIESMIFGDEGEDGEKTTLIPSLPGPPKSRRRPPRGRNPKGRPSRSRVVAQDGIERLLLRPHLYEEVLPRLAESGCLGHWDGNPGSPLHPLEWEGGDPWHLVLRLEIGAGGVAHLRGALERDGERAALGSALLLSCGQTRDEPSVVLFEGRLAPLEIRPQRDLPWIQQLETHQEIKFPKEELEEALITLLELPALPRLELPEELQLTEIQSSMQPRLVLEAEKAPEWMNPPLLAELSFLYGDFEVSVDDTRPAIVDWKTRTFLRRDMDGEQDALVRLVGLDLRPVSSEQGHSLELNPAQLPAIAEPLLSEGWVVEAHGTTLRPASPPSFRVESGIDWFELKGSLEFRGTPVDMAAALAAVSRGERFIRLEDGSQGLLPESLVEACDSLVKLSHGSAEEGLRFLPSQALLVDTLLEAMPPAQVDKPFADLRDKLRSLDRIKPKKELAAFKGELRGYQRQGLGWLLFLRDFGLGGVLADDMGLGKTVQVLALLLSCRTPAKTTKLPFLVVAPRSLIYNWIDEAQRFTPKLKVLQYIGPDRENLRETISDHDLVLTTYGTLRRDIAYLATVEFDTVILDEAQAIKNRDSQSAKASRLLNAQHRLALTGTPIENHLGELGSIFEYLNPTLFGRLPRLDVLTESRMPSKREIQLVAEGMRPFILRRTKKQVLPDLPPKTELTLYCDLEEKQRELYDQLRAHYQTNLMDQVESKGVGGSAFQVLEALLRLRQVACHPGLVNEEWVEAGASKLDTLYSRVNEVLAEGHKLIIFSQFTKLLGFVKKGLEELGHQYAYLDGQTRNRGDVVDRFQNDPECNLFLISIKAGGTGLNLTAAGYVFLLDPWWNPAVEAQAIDRAHRIGQTQPVFAYRLIARDTVEEKILKLQSSKRKLADAILEGDGQLLGELTAEDLQMLLS